MSNIEQALKAALAAIDLYDYTMTVEESEKFAKAERLCKSALAEIGKCETTINLNILKYTEYGVIPDDFKGQASGYRAGWNDCLSSIQYMFSQPIEKCEPALKVTNNGSQLSLTKPNGDYWDMSKHIGETFYTSPISKEWVGLSDQQIQNLIINSDNYNKFQFIKSVEHTVKQINAPEKG